MRINLFKPKNSVGWYNKRGHFFCSSANDFFQLKIDADLYQEAILTISRTPLSVNDKIIRLAFKEIFPSNGKKRWPIIDYGHGWKEGLYTEAALFLLKRFRNKTPIFLFVSMKLTK